LAHALRSGAITLLGIILAAVPLALWVAWTEAMLLAVVGAAVVSAALLVVLIDFGPPEADSSAAAAHDLRRRALPAEAIEEIHGIFPLTYHHSLVGRARFHRAMRRVMQMLGPERHSR